QRNHRLLGIINTRGAHRKPAAGILFRNMTSSAIVSETGILCETRPWSGSTGRGKFSLDPLDDRHEGGAKPGARGAVRFSRVVPALLVSALRLRSAQRAFAGRRPGLDTRFFPAPAGTPGAYGR